MMTQTASTPVEPLPTIMSAALARTYGNATHIEVDDLAVPAYTADQILVQVEASSLNALDWHFLTGTPYVLVFKMG